jgi:hypothetical protein
MNKLIKNQAAERTITMGASSSIIFHIMYKIIINLKDYKIKFKKIHCIKMIKRLESLKNAVNKSMADLRPTSQNGSRSYVDNPV